MRHRSRKKERGWDWCEILEMSLGRQHTLWGLWFECVDPKFCIKKHFDFSRTRLDKVTNRVKRL